MKLDELNRRRLANFRANRRGWWSFWIFLALFALSLCAELVANDRPILVRHDGAFYVPIAVAYPETAFGGEFETEADYRDPAVAALIEAKGWMLWPPVRWLPSSPCWPNTGRDRPRCGSSSPPARPAAASRPMGASACAPTRSC